jgi:large subunit ribosomal protein L18e
MFHKKISKTKITKQVSRKLNPELRRVVLLLKKQKNPFWHYVAKLLVRPKRKSIAVNLEKINKFSRSNSVILVAGKVLGQGNLEKKVQIYALNVSEPALKKIKESGSSYLEIEQLLQKNPDAKDIKLII